MSDEEKIALKTACLKAAAALMAARYADTEKATDVVECAKLTAELYTRMIAINWAEPPESKSVYEERGITTI
jgi:hypothetical protein